MSFDFNPSNQLINERRTLVCIFGVNQSNTLLLSLLNPVSIMSTVPPVKRKRGRPPGSKNKQKSRERGWIFYRRVQGTYLLRRSRWWRVSQSFPSRLESCLTCILATLLSLSLRPIKSQWFLSRQEYSQQYTQGEEITKFVFVLIWTFDNWLNK